MKSTTHRVIFSDSRDIHFLEDETIDLVVTSPPYPMIEMWDPVFSEMNADIEAALKNDNGKDAYDLMHEELDRVWDETARVTKEGGIVCINIGDATRTIGKVFRLYANHARILEKFMQLGFDALPKILWRKPTNAPNKFMGSGMMPVGAYVTLEHEYILIFRKGVNRKFSSDEEKRIRRESSFFWEERNCWFSDVWELKGVRQDTKHKEIRKRSGAFPFDLPFRLINMYSIKGDHILDPFLGLGTTLYAAMASERNSTGIEIDERFRAIFNNGEAGSFMDRNATISNELNSIIRDRIINHLDFINKYRARKNKEPYHNEHHDFQVVTRQEKHLKIRHIDNIDQNDGVFRVTYM